MGLLFKKYSLLIISLIAAAMIFYSVSGCEAAFVDPGVIDEIDLMELDATIMESHVWAGFIIVAEKKIELMQYMKRGRRYQTLVKNHRGKEIKFRRLKKGMRVYIRAYRMPDDKIVAREIYVLPGKANRKNFRRFPFLKKLPELEPVE